MSDEISIVVTAQDNFSGVLGNFGEIMSGLRDTIDLVGEAFTFAAEYVGDFVNSASESQIAVTKLDTVLSSMGGNAGIGKYTLEELAKSLQNVTIYSDETTMSAETMLLRFENINADIFPQTISLAADLATSLGIDLTSAARMLGMALDDPAVGIGRLNTAYRIFDPEQLKFIENMAKAGDVTGAQALIMQALTEKFGGAAEAIGQTFSGQLTIAENKIDDIKELIGGAFLPVLTDLLNMFIGYASNTQVIDFFKNMATSISEAIVSIESLFITPSTSTDIFTTIYEGGMALSTKIGTDVQPAVFKSLEDITAGVENRIALWFTSIDWGAIAALIDNNLAHAINSVDWNMAGAALRTGMNRLFETQLSTNVPSSSALAALGNAITSFIAGAFGYIDWKSLSGDFWTGFSNLFTAHFMPTTQHGIIGDWLVEEFNRSVQFVKDWWYNNKWEWATMSSSGGTSTIGNAMADGIIAGWNSAIGGLWDAVKWSFTHLLTTVNDQLGIASPSTVFANIGKNIMLGLITGIESMFSTVMAMITNIVGLLLAPFKPILDLLGIDVSGLISGSGSTGTTSGSIGGGSAGGVSTTTNPGGGGTSSGQVTNNYYGPVYFQGGSEPGSYIDCPSPNPLMASTGQTLVIHAL